MKNNPDQMQDCVVYARYSSHAQRDVSIEQQVADIEAYCKLNNLRIVKVYADRHLSGTNDKRPQFQQMLKDAARGRWKYVVTWKVDRFARNRYDSATYKYQLRKYGVTVKYAKENISEGPEGILLESILEGSAEYYSANLSQNVKRGMRYNAMQCKVNGGQHIPYGYKKGEDGRFAVSDAEADIAREIFRKVAQGVPFQDICRDLNGRNIPTKTGGKWGRSSFQRMLRNEAYIGVYTYADIRIEGGVPAIIDKTLFLQVQKRLKSKKNPQGRHRENGDYLLTGKLFCGPCSCPMVGMSGTGRHGEKYYYYVCQKKRRDDGCTKQSVARDWIERLVVKTTLDYILQDDVIQWVADRVIDYQNRAANSAQLLALRERLSENKKATDNIIKAIEAGIVTISTKQALERLEAEASELRDAVTLEEASLTKIDRAFIPFWMKQFRDGDPDDPEFRRKVIETYVSAVHLWDDRIRIVFNYSGKYNNVERGIVMDAAALAGAEGSLMLPVGSPQRRNKRCIACSDFLLKIGTMARAAVPPFPHKACGFAGTPGVRCIARSAVPPFPHKACGFVGAPGVRCIARAAVPPFPHKACGFAGAPGVRCIARAAVPPFSHR